MRLCNGALKRPMSAKRRLVIDSPPPRMLVLTRCIGRQCVVESAIGADGFYAKYGFVRCEDVNCTAEMPAQWQRLGEGEVQLYTWMRRPRR